MPLHGLDSTRAGMLAMRSRLNTSLKAVYLQGLGNIAGGTPVLEGRARNNWFLTTGTPFGGTTTTTSGNESYVYRMPSMVLGKKLYFTNNMPYINLLEYGGYPNPVKKGTYNKKTKQYEKHTLFGYSDQAVGGWVRGEMLMMRSAIRRI